MFFKWHATSSICSLNQVKSAISVERIKECQCCCQFKSPKWYHEPTKMPSYQMFLESLLIQTDPEWPRSFLQTIGAPVMAFDQIAGQRLAPYMSAVTRDAWSQHYPRIQTWLGHLSFFREKTIRIFWERMDV